MSFSVSPIHVIHRYRDDIYKVVTFKGTRDNESPYLREKMEVQHSDSKLDSNFSRARAMVLQYALCNPWDYFFTGTLNPAKFDRFDFGSFQDKLMQFIRDKRKKYHVKFQVLLVPEHHKDGAWHIHGLVYGLPVSVLSAFGPDVPRKLVDGHFLNWLDYQEKFGFCSLASIRDPVATAFYIAKYVSKDLSRRSDEMGQHLYFHSRPLKKAEKASEVYLYNRSLDKLCVNDYDFCKTGMVQGENWMFPFEWDGAEPVEEELLFPPEPLKSESDFRPFDVDSDYEQLAFDISR